MNARQERALVALAENGFPREAASVRADPDPENVRRVVKVVRGFKSATIGEAHTKGRAVVAVEAMAAAFEVDL